MSKNAYYLQKNVLLSNKYIITIIFITSFEVC